MGDVSSRRGQITDQEERGNAIIVRAMIPLSEMFGYVTDLRSFHTGPRQLLYEIRPLQRSTEVHR